MDKKTPKGVYLKEEVDFEPNLKKNLKSNKKTKNKGDKNVQKKKKINGENLSQ